MGKFNALPEALLFASSLPLPLVTELHEPLLLDGALYATDMPLADQYTQHYGPGIICVVT